MFAMSFIDAAIPGGIGLLLVLAPQRFYRASGNAIKDAASVRKFRTIGGVLLAVAAVYALIKASQYRADESEHDRRRPLQADLRPLPHAEVPHWSRGPLCRPWRNEGQAVFRRADPLADGTCSGQPVLPHRVRGVAEGNSARIGASDLPSLGRLPLNRVDLAQGAGRPTDE